MHRPCRPFKPFLTACPWAYGIPRRYESAYRNDFVAIGPWDHEAHWNLYEPGFDSRGPTLNSLTYAVRSLTIPTFWFDHIYRRHSGLTIPTQAQRTLKYEDFTVAVGEPCFFPRKVAYGQMGLDGRGGKGQTVNLFLYLWCWWGAVYCGIVSQISFGHPYLYIHTCWSMMVYVSQDF